MHKITRYGTAILVAHAAVSLLHDIAHRSLGIKLSLFQWTYVLLVFVLTPAASLILLWTRRLRVGTILLFLSMAGALIFAGVNHFIIVSEDHVMHAPQGALLSMFQLTAVVMAVIEVIGCWIGLWALIKLNKGASG